VGASLTAAFSVPLSSLFLFFSAIYAFQHCWVDPQGGLVTTGGLQVFMRYEAQPERAFHRVILSRKTPKRNAKHRNWLRTQKPQKAAEHRANQTLQLKKQVRELRKEEPQIRKNRVQAAAMPKTAPEPSPGEKKMPA
jgi:hypothetical protein